MTFCSLAVKLYFALKIKKFSIRAIFVLSGFFCNLLIIKRKCRIKIVLSSCKIKTFSFNRVQKHKKLYTITPFLYTIPPIISIFHPIDIHNTPLLYTIIFHFLAQSIKLGLLLPYFSTQYSRKTGVINVFL